MARSITDIAKALELSETTVSRALSGKGRVSPVTRHKVMQYAESNSYVPNSIAQSLVTAKANTIAFLMTHAPLDENVSFFGQCLAGVCRKASSMSYDVIVVNSDKKDEAELQRLIARRKVDGVMLNRELEPDVLDVLEQYQTPYVLLGASENTSVNQVDTDVVKGAEDLVARLVQDGIAKVAYIGEYDCYTVNKRRVQGFLNACDKNGVAERQVYKTRGMATQDEIDRAVRSAVAICECIITNDDVMCLRVMNALARMKIAIPDQIKLASLYHDYLLGISVPRITGVNHRPLDVGENAAKILISILEDDEYPKRGNKLWVDYELIMRESTQTPNGGQRT